MALYLIMALLLTAAATGEQLDDGTGLPLTPPGVAPHHRFHASAIVAIALAAAITLVAGVFIAYICCCRVTGEEEDRAVRPGDLQMAARRA